MTTARGRRRRRSTTDPAVVRRRWWWGNSSSRCGRRCTVCRRRRLLGLTSGLLLLLQEVDDEVLVVLDEVVVQSIGLELLSKVFPPVRVERLKRCKLRWGSAATVEAVGRDSRMRWRRGRWRGCYAARRVGRCLVGGVVSMATK